MPWKSVHAQAAHSFLHGQFGDQFDPQVLLDGSLDLRGAGHQFVHSDPAAVALAFTFFTANGFHQGQVFGEFRQVILFELLNTLGLDQVIVLVAFGMVGLFASTAESPCQPLRNNAEHSIGKVEGVHSSVNESDHRFRGIVCV